MSKTSIQIHAYLNWQTQEVLVNQYGAIHSIHSKLQLKRLSTHQSVNVLSTFKLGNYAVSKLNVIGFHKTFGTDAKALRP